MDAIDLSRARLCSRESPDVRTWPIFAALSAVVFADRERWQRGNVWVDFSGKAQLPPANGTQGPIAWTLWGGFQIGGEWCLAPLVECIGDDYIPTGPLFAANHVADNLLYYAEAPLRKYQPTPGEPMALLVTTGDTRRQNAQVVPPARTSVVVVPFQVGEWRFAESAAPAPSPAPTSGPAPAPGPAPAAADVVAALLALTQAVSVLTDDVHALKAQQPPTYVGSLKLPKWPSYLGGPIDATVTLEPKR